jgi:methionyl-tRNA formyltransferase
LTPQEDAAATYCRKLQKEDGVLDFLATASALAARVNGLFPWPGCTVEINGQPVKLGLADAVPGAEIAATLPNVADVGQRDARTPGEVLGADAHGVLVATGEGVLRLRRLQRPGGRMLPAPEFLRGFPMPAGTRLPSQPMPPLVTTR